MNAFVGRRDELEALAEAADRAATGPSVALVVGEAGCGKTRLMAEAASRLQLVQRFRVVGYEPERQVPLAAASSMLRGLAASGPEGRQLDRLAFGTTALEAATLDPVRVFESAHRAFRSCEPALLLLDDLQWADGLSLALVHYLLRAAADTGQRLIAFAALRPGHYGTAFAGSLEATLADDRVTRIELGALDRADSVALARELAPWLEEADAVAIWRAARGSPFWIDALVRSGGHEARAERLVTERLRGAGADAGALLAMLAVAGAPVLQADLAELLDWPADRLQVPLSELVQRGLARETAGAVEIAHDLIRAAAETTLPDVVRRRLHRRLARWLDASATDDVQLLRQLLEHRRAAGEPAAEVAVRLTRSPRRRLLGDEVLPVLTAIADHEPESLLDEHVAALAAELGRQDVALERWVLTAQQRSAPAERAAALLEASRAAFALGRPQEANAHLRRSCELERRMTPIALAQDVQRAELLLWGGIPEAEAATQAGRDLAYDVASRARRLVRRSGGPDALPRELRSVYLDALQVEEEAAKQHGDARRRLASAEDRILAARGFDECQLLAASVVAAETGSRVARLQEPPDLALLRESRQRLRHAWLEARRRVLPQQALDAGYWLVRALEEEGELREAADVVAELVQLARRVRDMPRDRFGIDRLACDLALYRDPAGGHAGAGAPARVERERARPHRHAPAGRDLALAVAPRGRCRGRRGPGRAGAGRQRGGRLPALRSGAPARLRRGAGPRWSRRAGTARARRMG